MLDSLYYERHLQGINVVVFSVAKSSICFVEYNFHNSMQTCLKEGIGHWAAVIAHPPDRTSIKQQIGMRRTDQN